MDESTKIAKATEKEIETKTESIEAYHNKLDYEQHPLRSQFSFVSKICLIYGLCYSLFAYNNPDGIGSGIFALISVCMILFIANHLKKAESQYIPRMPKINVESIFYLLMAVLISFGNCITDYFFFHFFNHIGSFLLFSIGLIKLFYQDKLWDFGKYFASLFLFWIHSFASIDSPFRDFAFYRQNREHKHKISPTTKYIIIGILCGFPILLITTVLLASADMVFFDMLKTIFDLDALNDFLYKLFFEDLFNTIFVLPFCFCFYVLLLYLIFCALSANKIKEDVKQPHLFHPVVAITMLTMVDIVYVIFSGIQFIYLFGGLPAGVHSYSEYARQGFFQLFFVALINYILVSFCNTHFGRNLALKITLTVATLCTYVMIASSAYRMILYIDAYNLTFMRVFVLWFLVTLVFLMLGQMISIYKKNWNSFRYSLFVFTLFYTVFALSNVNTRIAQYNVEKFIQDKTQKKEVSLYEYLPYEYSNSFHYADSLYELYSKNGNLLSDEDSEMIQKYYLSITYYKDVVHYDTNIFNNDEGHDVYNYNTDENYYIYEPDTPSSPLAYKHYNFMEAKAYSVFKKMYPK